MQDLNIDRLKVKVYDTRLTMGVSASSAVSNRIKELLNKKEEVNIIFAAAPSQNEFLQGLLKAEDIEWERVNAFHMDEYIGLLPDAVQRFGNFLRIKIFEKLQFKNVFYINGNATNIEEECIRYSELLRAYPSDIVCIGIGENGHIAFNDPHVANFSDGKLVKIVDLDEKCRQQQVNDGCFESITQVPTHAITLTIPALINSKYIYCMVPGENKKDAVFQTFCGEIAESCPASILRLHPNAIMFTDLDSSGRIIGR